LESRSIDEGLMRMASMLDRFLRMLMGTNAVRRKDAEQAAFRTLNAVAPLVSGMDRAPVEVAHSDSPLASPPRGAIMCREAVLGKDKRVAGYSLSLGYKMNPRVRASSVSMQRLYDKVLVRNLQDLGIQRLLTYRLAFVDVSASFSGRDFSRRAATTGNRVCGWCKRTACRKPRIEYGRDDPTQGAGPDCRSLISRGLSLPVGKSWTNRRWMQAASRF